MRRKRLSSDESRAFARKLAAFVKDNPCMNNKDIAAALGVKVSYIHWIKTEARAVGIDIPAPLKGAAARARGLSKAERDNIKRAILQMIQEGDEALTLTLLSFRLQRKVDVIKSVCDELGLDLTLGTTAAESDYAIRNGRLERDLFYIEETIHRGGWPGFCFTGGYWERYRKIWGEKRLYYGAVQENPASVWKTPPREFRPQLSGIRLYGEAYGAR